MPVRPASKAAFIRLKESLGRKKGAKKCLQFIHDNPGCTRNDIERGTGMRQASVSGRVNDLLKLEAVYEDGCRRDEITGQSNNKLWCSCCIDSAGFSIQGNAA